MKHIVSFSGGKDSTAMLLLMIENNVHFDEVVFFDTGWEFPEMLKHIDKVEKDTGIKIIRLRPKKSFDYWMFNHVKTKGKNKGQVGYSWPQANLRWCTALKRDTLKVYFNSLGEHIQYEGIAIDEPTRIKEGKRYPLVEFGYTEQMALDYCYNKGYDWSGVYKFMTRVSCFCCPLQREENLRGIFENRPLIWDKMKQMDSMAYTNFRQNMPLYRLESRFKQQKLF